MLKIRLKRTGRRHDPSFRLVVVESSRGPKSGQYIENLGLYDPRANVKQINTERVQHWISQGAQTSETAHNLLVDLGVVNDSKVNVLPQKSPIVSESEQATSADTTEGGAKEGDDAENGAETEDEEAETAETDDSNAAEAKDDADSAVSSSEEQDQPEAETEEKAA